MVPHGTGSCNNEQERRGVLIFNCFLLGSTSLIGILANLLVFVVVFRSRTLRTAKVALLVNLAAGDLLRCCLDSPLFLTSLLLGDVNSGSVVCLVQQGTYSLCSCVQLLSVVAISVDRHQAVAFPFRMDRRKERIRGWILLIWLCGFFVAVLSLTLCKESKSYIMCRRLHMDELTVPGADPFGAYVLVPVWISSIVLIVVHYVRIFLVVRQHNNKIADMGMLPKPRPPEACAPCQSKCQHRDGKECQTKCPPQSGVRCQYKCTHLYGEECQTKCPLQSGVRCQYKCPHLDGEGCQSKCTNQSGEECQSKCLSQSGVRCQSECPNVDGELFQSKCQHNDGVGCQSRCSQQLGEECQSKCTHLDSGGSQYKCPSQSGERRQSECFLLPREGFQSNCQQQPGEGCHSKCPHLSRERSRSECPKQLGQRCPYESREGSQAKFSQQAGEGCQFNCPHLPIENCKSQCFQQPEEKHQSPCPRLSREGHQSRCMQRPRVRCQSKSLRLPGDIVGAVCVLTPRAKELGKKRLEGKLAKRFGYIIITIILLWIPLVVMLMLRGLVDEKRCKWLLQELETSALVLTCLPAALDPLISTSAQNSANSSPPLRSADSFTLSQTIAQLET